MVGIWYESIISWKRRNLYCRVLYQVTSKILPSDSEIYPVLPSDSAILPSITKKTWTWQPGIPGTCCWKKWTFTWKYCGVLPCDSKILIVGLLLTRLLWSLKVWHWHVACDLTPLASIGWDMASYRFQNLQLQLVMSTWTWTFIQLVTVISRCWSHTNGPTMTPTWAMHST